VSGRGPREEPGRAAAGDAGAGVEPGTYGGDEDREYDNFNDRTIDPWTGLTPAR